MEKESFDRIELINAMDALSALKFDHLGRNFDLSTGYVLAPYDVIGATTPGFWLNNRFTVPYIRAWWNGTPFLLRDKSATGEEEALLSGLITIAKEGQREFIVKKVYDRLVYIEVKEGVITHEKIPGPEISKEEFWMAAYRGSDRLLEEIGREGKDDPIIRFRWDERVIPRGGLVPRRGITDEELHEWLTEDYYMERYTHS